MTQAPPINPNAIPKRPPPLIELGDRFFGPGPLQHGFMSPTGATWTPNLTVFGTDHSAFQAYRNPATGPGETRSEWANRLDLYINLQLTGTERVLVGFRPFDNGQFARPGLAHYTGYDFGPGGADGWVWGFRAEPTTCFFEGDLGQLFPMLDPIGTTPWDIGFSVGRQPLLYQEGMLIDDDLDCIGITRNTMLPAGSSNMQVTLVWGWDQINANDGIDHGDHNLIGAFINADIKPSTWNLDLVYVNGNNGLSDGLYGGISAAQRIWKINSTFRVLGSLPLGHSTVIGSPLSAYGDGASAVGGGVLLFSELSYTIPRTTDLVYLDSFWGIDRFTSAARGPDRGGPLGRVGILFAEQPIGRFGSALSSDPERAVGFALGYQKFIDPGRRQQVTLELGARINTTDETHGAVAAGALYQQAFGQRIVLQLMTFFALNEAKAPGYGARAEVRYEF